LLKSLKIYLSYNEISYPSQNGPGKGFFDLDAQTFADWGVDSFKFDGCNQEPKDFDRLFPIMMDSLNKTGRRILYSCEWPLYQYFHNPKIQPNYPAVAKTCNLYRNNGDVSDSWDSISSIIDFYGDNSQEFSKYNGPGNWMDPDMLTIGNFGLSYHESRAQMAMWAIWASPLYMSNNLRKITSEMKNLLQNKKVIAVNQDAMGKMGTRVYKVNF
jgi:alpha-N-acetylgalactosaminidase